MDAQDERRARILVVDDDVHLQKALVRTLERLGYEVELAKNGVEGLRRAVENPPNVILTDIRMPELDGHTLMRRLSTQNLDSAIVVMSAHGDMADVIEVMRRGAIDYLTKPWTPSELAAAIARACEINQARLEARALAAKPPVAPVAKPSTGATPAAAATPSHDAIFSTVLEQLKRGEIVLPAIPGVIAELAQVVADPSATVDSIAEVISRDPRASAQLLKLANSAQYSRNGHSNDVHTAVRRVGLTQIKSIAETLRARACFPVSEPRFLDLQQRVWRHSIARAVSMRALAELSMTSLALDGETAYCASLLADVGASFLIWLGAERAAAGSGSSPHTLESCVIAIQEHHAEIGSLLLARWNMDPTLVYVAAHHHDDAPPAPKHPYWAVSVLAAEMADSLTGAEDLTRPEPLPRHVVDRCAAEVGIGVTLREQVKTQLLGELNAVLESIE